jgi:hypothetical protein
MGEDSSGGVHISGEIGSIGGSVVGGDNVGGDKITNISSIALDRALCALSDVIDQLDTEKRLEAQAKLAELKNEVSKGKAADDGAIAKLVDGLVGLVPAAATAVVSAFATPILGGIAGPITTYVLERLRGG